MTASPHLDLDDVILAYLKSIDGGEPRDPAGWVARFPQFADELGTFLAWERGLETAGAIPTPFSIETDEPPDYQVDAADQSVTTDRFELGAELGHGGIGMVRRAHDPVLNRQLAIKLLRSRHRQHPQVAARFLAEARIAAGLEHPGIPPVHDVGQASDGRPFIAMKLIEGRTLAELLHERPAPDHDLPRFLKIFEQVAQTVAYAHSKGVMHRDLKPHNVMSGAFGEVQVMDWGLAKFFGAVDSVPEMASAAAADGAAADDTSTRAGTILGTPAYMAPEQARGEIDLLDAHVDVFGLGAILCQILTGRPAFTTAGPLEQARRGDLAEAFARLDQCGCDAELISLTKRCLAPVAADRPPNGQAVAEAMTAYLNGVQERLRQVELTSANAAEIRKRRRLLSVALVLAVIGSAGAALWLRVERDAARTAEKQTGIAEREARLREAEALVGQAHGIRLSRREGQRFAALAALTKAAEIGRELKHPPEWFDKLRNEAIAALALPDLHIAKQWPGWPEGTTMAAVSADGRVYGRADPTGAISLRRMDNDQEISRVPGAGGPVELWLSRDGAEVAQVARPRDRKDHVARVWRLGPKGPQERVRADAVRVLTFMDRPEGRLIVFIHHNGSLSTYDVSTGERQALLAAFHVINSNDRGRIVAHPQEPLVAISSYLQRDILVRHVLTGEVVCRETPPWAGGSTCAWHPSGDYLFICASDTFENLICAFDFSKRSLTHRGQIVGRGGHGGEPFLSFNARGDRYFAHGWSPRVTMWDFWTGKKLFETRTHARSLALAINDNRLSLAALPGQPEQLGTWAVADAREYRPLVAFAVDEKVGAHGFALHPEGRLLAAHFSEGIRLFDLVTGAEAALLPHPKSAESTGLHFDATGALYTNNFSGMHRWPVRLDSASPPQWIVGPPERLPFHPGDRGVATSRDGKVIAQAMFVGYGMAAHSGGWILHPGAAEPRRVDADASFNPASVSPDGRWVAFADILGPAKVFEAATGRLVWQTSHQGGCSRFSADGRWLLTGIDRGRAYAADTWLPGPDLGPGRLHDCTADGGLAVLGLESGIYRLVEMATGRELARLEDPDQSVGHALFTPDGTKLVAQAADGLRVWDLSRIRSELAKMELDWDAPPYRTLEQQITTPMRAKLIGLSR